MNQKKLITILATITIIAILSVSLFFTQFAASTATTYNADYMTVEGVLGSDNYVLYPFENTSMKIGFSKYGEMIDTNTNVGLEYGDVDPFAAPAGSGIVAGLPKKYWSQGWFINITYVHRNLGHRNVWAMAVFADMVDFDNPWLRVDWGTNNYDDGPTKGEPGLWGYESPGDPGYPIGGAAVLMNGGRKTNGTVITQPITVLYDGPRRFVALLNSTIYDYTGTPPDEALVKFCITIVFDKVKKDVILFKDVKSVISFKVLEGEMNVQLSNRGQVDLGTTTKGFKSYAHFYTEGIGIYDVSEEGQSTVYDSEYEMTRTETPCKIYNGTATTNTNSSRLCDTAENWPVSDLTGYKVAILNGTGAGQVRTIASNGTHFLVVTSAWTTTPTTGSQYGIYDPNCAALCKTADGRWPQTSATNATYDIAQAINPTAGYVWSAAFWPSLSDWSISGWAQQFRSMDALDPHYIDMPLENDVPYYIGEWDFDLGDSLSANCMFRGVTAYSLVDQHDADDANMGITHTNVIDSEIQYLMDETFNPYDLYNAVHKQESRWVYIDESLESATNYITLTEGLDDDIYQPNGYTTKPWSETTWTGYNYTLLGTTATFDWKNEFEDEIDAHSKNWVAHLNSGNGEAMLKVTPTGYGVNITGALNFSSIVDFGFWYYSLPDAGYGPHIEFELYNSTGTGYVVLGADANDEDYPNPTTGQWIHYTLNDIGSFVYQHDADKAFWIRWAPKSVLDDLNTDLRDLDDWPDDLHSFEWWQRRLGSFYVGSVGVSARADYTPGANCYIDDLSIAYLDKASGIRYERVYNMEEDKLIPSDWDAYCSFAERVLINGVLIDREGYEGTHEPYYQINFENGTITFHHWVTSAYTTWLLPIGTHIKVLYSTIEENEKGRYEWIVVGTDAASIANVGAAYVAEAFDSIKDIAVLKTGMDIRETTWGPNAPYVMSGPGTRLRSNYYDSLGRSHLRDDWCTTYPIASSDMIFIGGPRATLGTEYFNEFTNAFFAESEWVVNNTGQANKILALTCWNRTTYFNNATTGYAQISVYKDLNGTIGFLVWGYDGQDTYYAAKWFWEEGIEYLQTENCGVTDIILEIDYTECPYSVSVTEERLGTISEKTPHDP